MVSPQRHVFRPRGPCRRDEDGYGEDVAMKAVLTCVSSKTSSRLVDALLEPVFLRNVRGQRSILAGGHI